jgi:Transposase
MNILRSRTNEFVRNSIQSLHSQRNSGPTMDLPLRRRDAELPPTVDRSASVARFGALPETGKDAAGASGRHPELLSNEGSLGVVEAVNGNIKSLLRRGRGYQNLRYLLLKAQRIAATKTEFVVFRKAA